MLRKNLTGDPFLEHYRVVSLEEVNPEDREEIILSNIEGFIDEHKGDRDNFFLAIPGSKVIFKSLSLPSPTEENLREVLGFEMDRYTPFSLDDVYFDFKVVERDDARKLIQVVLVVIKKEVLNYYLTLLQRIHIKVRGVEVATTALYNLIVKGGQGRKNGAERRWVVRTSEWLSRKRWGKKLLVPLDRMVSAGKSEAAPAEEGTRFLITIDDESCELGAIRDGRLIYSRCLTMPPQDEGESVAERVEKQADQMLLEIAATQLTLSDENPERSQLIVAGTGAHQSFISHLKEREHIDARLVDDLVVNVTIDNAREKATFLSVAMGVALKGLKGVALDMNLIPRELRPKKKKNWNLILGVTLAVLLLLGIGSFTLAFFVKERMYFSGLTERVKALKGRVEEVEQMQKEIAAIESKIDSLEKIKADDTSKLQLLKELTQIIPEEMWLTQFSYQERKGKKEIDLSGYATAASELIPILEESKLFEDVKFKSSIVKDKESNKEKFNVTASVSSSKIVNSK